MRRLTPILLVLGACATEGPDVQPEIERFERAAASGIATVRQALKDPTLENLGTGLDTVEYAAVGLRHISEDERQNAGARVSATLAEARAYDDVALSLARIEPTGALAQPYRTAARDAYVRARSVSCRTGLAEPAMMLEILDGVARYVGDDAVTEPCPR